MELSVYLVSAIRSIASFSVPEYPCSVLSSRGPFAYTFGFFYPLHCYLNILVISNTFGLLYLVRIAHTSAHQLDFLLEPSNVTNINLTVSTLEDVQKAKIKAAM